MRKWKGEILILVLIVIVGLSFFSETVRAQTTYYFWRFRSHADDVTAITTGWLHDLGYQDDTSEIFICDNESGASAPENWLPVKMNSQNSTVLTLGSPDNDSIGDAFRVFNSAGRLSGGVITQHNTDATVDVSVGQGIIRTADDTSAMKFFVIPATWSVFN